MERATVAFLLMISVGIISPDANGAPPWYRDKKSPSTEPACKVAAGEWSKTPFFKAPFCRMKFADGGKECRRANDCQSLICVVDEPDHRSGRCHGEAERFATFWYLDENGKTEKISVE
jgi:hypothetical protein